MINAKKNLKCLKIMNSLYDLNLSFLLFILVTKVNIDCRPCVMFLNTIAYQSIKKKEMISLDANEALVVYKKEEKTNDVKRYIKYGPSMFMPLASEWYVLLLSILLLCFLVEPYL